MGNYKKAYYLCNQSHKRGERTWYRKAFEEIIVMNFLKPTNDFQK